MNPVLTEARTVLQTAEKGLRDLMAKAIQQGRYAEVAHLAEMAKVLCRACREWTGADPDKDVAAGPTASAPSRAAVAAPAPAAISRKVTKKAAAIAADAMPKYPKFEVDEDRLVKIAWSKREKGEYFHKASRDAALAVYLHLGSVPTAATFRMEDLLPVKLPDDTQVPSYQSYLVLAWLRHIHQIEKRANDSYQWVVEEINESSFDKAWDATPRRGVPGRAQRG